MTGLYDSALDAGLSPESFWEHSPGEVTDMIRSHERQREKDLKIRISLNFVQADVIRRRLFPGEDGAPQPWDYFPTLYVAEKEAFEKQEEQEELEEFKLRRRSFMQEHNKKFKQGGGESDGGSGEA